MSFLNGPKTFFFLFSGEASGNKLATPEAVNRIITIYFIRRLLLLFFFFLNLEGKTSALTVQTLLADRLRGAALLHHSLPRWTLQAALPTVGVLAGFARDLQRSLHLGRPGQHHLLERSRRSESDQP